MLGEWLKAQGQRKREPGIWDCAAAPAQWLVACGYPDPLASYLAQLDHDEPAELTAMFDEALAAIGVTRRSGEAQMGDIGVLTIEGREAGSIFTGKRWTFIGDRGLSFASLDPECVKAVWAVGHG